MMASSQSVRVLIVDDSAIVRGLVTKILEADPVISVVASASNGKRAIEALDRVDVEVVVLDIEMPVMDGIAALPELLRIKPDVKIIMSSTLTHRNAEVSLRALQLGAADYVTKPSSGSGSGISSTDSFKRELTEKVRALGRAARSGSLSGRPASERMKRVSDSSARAPAQSSNVVLRASAITPPKVLAIGSSTGGPQALTEFLGGLGRGFDLPIMITQHMPATFTTLLASHLAKSSKRPCAEAEDGESLQYGRIYVAPGGRHMTVERSAGDTVISLNDAPPENFCRPSADPMLRSLSEVYGAGVLVVILTGMGSDGQKGAETVVRSGGAVIAQDEASSVVWGMPGAVAAAGLCSAVLPLGQVAPYVEKIVMRSAA